MNKNKYIILIAIFVCLIENSFAQSRRDMEKFGFIDLRTDSMQVPFYVDGIFIGKHPLNNPVPVLPGFHLVSYLPPELTKKYVEEDLSDAYKRVYVAPNDTLEVFLFYEHYVVETKTLDRQYICLLYTSPSPRDS